MSEHIKYSNQSRKRAFADMYFGTKFANVDNLTPAQQTGIFYKKANEHRKWFKPIFIDETKYVPNLLAADIIKDYPTASNNILDNNLDTVNKVFDSTNQSNSSQSLTIPPNKQNQNIMIKALLVGAGLYLAYQIIE